MFLELGLSFVCRLFKPDHQENLERTRAGTSWNASWYANWNELERTRDREMRLRQIANWDGNARRDRVQGFVGLGFKVAG
ncbi:hypothetical protein F2Q69_00004179 [Brassica cretica]|uniref:Uncharacterized protein n=1 Tax=Brassica cretica TaxID=69181 RepID=A0A8S9P5R9_BRACR|nr:hypothetical protein F2Q69_00004179 [Brassica cretica]